MSVYVNRALNLRKIKVIGFDMDYTIVRYHSEAFERLAFEKMIEKLIANASYPDSIRTLHFNHRQVIQGLVIDVKRGNFLKLSRFGKVKQSAHGTRPIDFKNQQDIYRGRVIDLTDPHVQSLDTAFSIASGVLMGLLIDEKDKGRALPDYEDIVDDVKMALDSVHADGTLKAIVRENIGRFIVQDEALVRTLERLKKYGKSLWLITNSEFSYTQLLLDYAIQPFLKNHAHWSDLFNIVITYASKPAFFTGQSRFLSIDPATGLMSNATGAITHGIFQGGSANKLQRDTGFSGDEILYIGDHIYGDVVSLKRHLNWRTALVVEPLEDELRSLEQSLTVQGEIDRRMSEKEKMEHVLYDLYRDEVENGVNTRETRNQLFSSFDPLDESIGKLITEYQSHFNPYWGELMRAGQEESYFAGQIERYACIYMARISDLLGHSPRTYFRPARRLLPHERST